MSNMSNTKEQLVCSTFLFFYFIAPRLLFRVRGLLLHPPPSHQRGTDTFLFDTHDCTNPPCVMSCSSLASPLCPVLFCPTCQRCSSNHPSLARSIICICHPLSTDNSTVCLFVSASEPVCRACVFHAPFKRVKSTKPKKQYKLQGQAHIALSLFRLPPS